MAEQSAIRFHLCGAHHIQLVEFHILGPVHRRFGRHRVVDLEGLSGWRVHIIIHRQTYLLTTEQLRHLTDTKFLSLAR